MVLIENSELIVEINEAGAELNRIYNKKTKIDYLWSGDPKFWGRKAPILFPIVGKLKSNRMIYKGNEYHMPQHGFARDSHFRIEESGLTKTVFSFKSDETTKKMFPFDWSLFIEYNIKHNELEVKTKVINDSNSEYLYFSIGYHPAFCVPFDENLKFEDYSIHFNADEKSERWLIKDGLIDTATELAFDNGILPLDYGIFEKDALVFKGLKSNEIQIMSQNSKHGISFSFNEFPYVGIWSKPGSAFVCIEPWHGIADNIKSNGDFTLKEGILKLDPGNDFICGYNVAVF